MQIFLLDMEGGFRGQASGQKWHEDLQWSHRLDQGWNLSAVKQVTSPSPATLSVFVASFSRHCDCSCGADQQHIIIK